jgi:hypothetical protein
MANPVTTAPPNDDFTASFGPADTDTVQSGSEPLEASGPTATDPASPDGDAEAPVDDQHNAQPDDTPADDGEQDDTGGNREAAKYRRRLRATEAERDALRDRLNVLQRSEVERLVADRLRDPSDIWRDGAQIADVLDDGGNVDATKVTALAGAVLKAHQHWAADTTPVRKYGPRSGASVPGRRRDQFTAAFAPREH